MDTWLKIGHARGLFWSLFAVVLIPLIGTLDALSSAEFTFSLIYLIPAMILAWVHGRAGALAASLATGLLWLYVDLVTDRFTFNIAVYAWNFFSRLMVQTAISLLLAALRSSLTRQYRLARLDSLTGVLNRRGFEELADREVGRSKRYRSPLTLAYFDIDNFKQVNDSAGHAVGDRLLREFATDLKAQVRVSDIVARLGGDEFAVLLTECGAEGAKSAVRKIQDAASATFTDRYPVSLSLGVITYLAPPESTDAMVRRADGLMYQVKQGGKNAARFIHIP